MSNNRWRYILPLLVIFALIMAACGQAATSTPVPPTEEAAAEETEEAVVEETEEAAAEETEEAAAEETEAPAPEIAEATGDLAIGLVTDVGEVDDRSFNQSAWEGVQAVAEAYGAESNYIETQDSTDYAANIAEFAENGYDVIVTVGFALGEATLEAAAEYPDVYFIGVDQFQGAELPNVVGLVFHEDQAGYLAGFLAGRLTESNIVAGVYGTDQVPPVVAFGTGFENGAMASNPDVEVITTYHPGGIDVAFTDPEWGGATAAQAIDRGADVIFAAGGKTGNGGLTEVANRTTEDAPLFCIGVDSDQWETVPEAHDCLVTSAVKLIPVGIEQIMELHQAGEAPVGNFYGPVGLASFHDFEETVPADLQEELATLAEQLTSGEVETGYAPGSAPAPVEEEATEEAAAEEEAPAEATEEATEEAD